MTEQTKLDWRRSTRCEAAACVEVAKLPDGAGMAMRDGKDPDGPALTIPAAAWTAFTAAVRAGDFDA